MIGGMAWTQIRCGLSQMAPSLYRQLATLTKTASYYNFDILSVYCKLSIFKRPKMLYSNSIHR